MIGQVKKPIKEILDYLDGKKKIVIYGCGGCASVFHTGGEPEVNEMKDILIENGKEVLAAVAPPFGEFTCYAPWSKKWMDSYKNQINDCDAVLINLL